MSTALLNLTLERRLGRLEQGLKLTTLVPTATGMIGNETARVHKVGSWLWNRMASFG